LKCVGYVFGVGGIIVVSHDGPEAVRRGHLAQETSTGLGGERGFRFVSYQGHGDKVSGEGDQIGVKAVDHGDGGAQRVDREIRIVVEIAEHGDSEAIQPFRPARQEKLLADDARPVRGQQERISDNRERTGGGSGAKKLASCGGNQQQTSITQ
jgi:hypothetical protein